MENSWTEIVTALRTQSPAPHILRKLLRRKSRFQWVTNRWPVCRIVNVRSSGTTLLHLFSRVIRSCVIGHRPTTKFIPRSMTSPSDIRVPSSAKFTRDTTDIQTFLNRQVVKSNVQIRWRGSGHSALHFVQSAAAVGPDVHVCRPSVSQSGKVWWHHNPQVANTLWENQMDGPFGHMMIDSKNVSESVYDKVGVLS